ncbi:MAG: OmpA family protein [Polyangiaceae bacterium]
MKKTHARSLVLVAVSSLALLSGCADDKTQAKAKTAADAAKAQGMKATTQGGMGSRGANGPVGTSDLPNKENGDLGGVATPALHVSEEITQACELPRQDYAPAFEFDSSSIGDDDKDLLAALAKCLSEGALKDRKVALVGRADERGEMEYNMSLGETRADSVRRYLGSLGVDAGRVSSTSRGELDATGKDESGWAKDRRVDIQLSN